VWAGISSDHYHIESVGLISAAGGHRFELACPPQADPRYRKEVVSKGNLFVFMRFTVYVLFSETGGKHYVGFTGNLQQRLLSHNELSCKGWTIRYRPWKLIYTELFETKAEAMKRERWLKSGVGRDFIRLLPH
jgi:putative endonuclease